MQAISHVLVASVVVVADFECIKLLLRRSLRRHESPTRRCCFRPELCPWRSINRKIGVELAFDAYKLNAHLLLRSEREMRGSARFTAPACRVMVPATDKGSISVRGEPSQFEATFATALNRSTKNSMGADIPTPHFRFEFVHSDSSFCGDRYINDRCFPTFAWLFVDREALLLGDEFSRLLKHFATQA